MPEGDTIHRAAAAMRTALVDQKMTYFEAPRLVGVVPRAGRTIERIDSHGKHLEMEWDDGVILHTHVRTSGAWHLYRTGQSWQRNHREVRALVEVDGWVAVCFNAPVVETYRRHDASRHPGRGGLGPDLSRDDADLRRCVDALLAHEDGDTTIAELLLDHRVFCGVGNVYRCEVLWVSELSPFAAVRDLPESEAVRVVDLAAELLRANLVHAQRVTIPGVRGGLGVYGRSGQRCQRCGETISSRRTGRDARILYWCPGCQVRHDPHLTGVLAAAPAPPPMDPHPAASQFLADLPWRRPA